MLDCGHIFCLQCLQDFYKDAIQEGNVSTIRCLAPNCAKERLSALSKDGKPSRKSKTTITPSELLQIGLSEETVKRYVMLKYKTELESDKNTIYCPRQWCGGAARSKKHKKPSGLDFEEAPDHESDQESDHDSDNEENESDESSGKNTKESRKSFDPADLLAICEDCKFAFCSRCLQTWHGEFVSCAPKRDTEELTEEEKASLEYLKLHTSPCPTCNAPAQKTHGCNHMICSRCETHFCYLCSAWLDPVNPYRHYNEAPDGKVTSCYMRLWELEGGDGDDVGLGYAGGQRLPDIPVPPAAQQRVPPVEVINNVEAPRNRQRRPNQQLDENGRPIGVDREAPLVLRLVDNPDNARAPAPAPAPQPAPAAGRGQNLPHRGGAAQRGQHFGRGRGGRGGARGARGREHQANRPTRGPLRGPAGGPVGGPAGGALREPLGGPARNANVELNAAQEAWVRHFVQMALLDVEDEIDDDLDANDELFRIR